MKHTKKKCRLFGVLLTIFLVTSPAYLHAADFAARCQTPGVVSCVGFDIASEINAYIYPDGNGAIRGTLDSNIKASGSGSLRFEIPSRSGANSSGGWLAPLGDAFGPGETFYVQFRQRFSPEMLNTAFAGGGGWKQAIFHMGTKSCAGIELTTQNTYYRGYPQMYSQCGADPFEVDLGNGDFLYQQGDYNCHRWNENSIDCSYYRENQWMTFYYEVKIGNWGQPNSSIKAWVAYEGQPLKQFINIINHRLEYNSSPSDVYNSVTLTPYNTNKSESQSYPTAYVWFDELIVSTQPIPAPDSSSNSQPPAPPSNLAIN